MRIERRPGAVVVVGGPVPPGADAITIGSVISVRAGHERSPYLMRHEAVHVRQWHRFGLVGFAARYLGLVREVAALPEGPLGRLPAHPVRDRGRLAGPPLAADATVLHRERRLPVRRRRPRRYA